MLLTICPHMIATPTPRGHQRTPTILQYTDAFICNHGAWHCQAPAEVHHIPCRTPLRPCDQHGVNTMGGRNACTQKDMCVCPSTPSIRDARRPPPRYLATRSAYTTITRKLPPPPDDSKWPARPTRSRDPTSDKDWNRSPLARRCAPAHALARSASVLLPWAKRSRIARVANASDAAPGTTPAPTMGL